MFIHSCKTTFPKTETDCVNEAKYILDITAKPNYSEKLEVLKKYEAFKDYGTSDYEKTYIKLNEYLVVHQWQNMTIEIKKDTSKLNFEGAFNAISYLEISFLDAKKEDESKSICVFRYSIADNEDHYVLSYFKHNLNAKVKPVLPK